MSACLIPEILFQIAPLLDTHAHLSCLQVCRLWHTVFTPYFWSNINDYNWPWCNLLKPLDNSKRSNSTPLRGALNPKARLFQDRLSKYHDHVRHLTINYDSLLLIAFEAQLTQLISLHIRAHFVSTHRYSRIRYDSTLPSDPTALRLSRQVDDSRVPESIFFQVPEVTYHLSIPHAMEFTRKCWHLILDNTTTLQSLRIMKNSRQTLLRLAPPSRARDFPYLRADSIGFLKGTLEKMSRLNELEVGSQAEEFVLQSIGRELEGKKFLPLVTGLHYSARPGNALLTLLHPPADLDTNGNVNVNNNTHSTEQDERQISVNTTVKVLTLHSTVSIACLRDLLVIFPRLQELSGAAHDFLTDASHHGAQVGEFDRIIVSNIKYMTGLCHEFHLFRFNIRLPCLRSIGPQLYFRNVQDMMQVLQLCPELEILEVKELRGMDDHMAVMYVNLHTQRDLEMSGGGGSHIVDGDDDNGDGEGDVDGSGITRRRAGMDWRIQTLTIQHSQYRGHTIQQLLRRMPNLVHLELGSISAKAVEVIGETCYGSLEDVRQMKLYDIEYWTN
ncbi:hypothetical protein BGZ95_005364 [Linnemannia exigua]|uniref:F-box domain-containing protein n=1 Tax=Linnemannia exigua TaxID=604196 RepID=A0AAD4DH86_9FUNG|nr:hypothetical protein BGZ95_005364 [Linnemannia exigua]